MCERRTAIDIPQRVDTGDVCLQPVVDQDEAAGVNVHAGSGEVELLGIRHSSGGDEEVGAGDGPLLRRIAQLYVDAGSAGMHGDRFGFEQDLDAIHP